MKVGVIPARKNSVGLRRKNLQKVGGLTLVERSIIQALDSCILDKVIVTSDDREVLSIASDYPDVHLVRRPPRLATSRSSSVETTLHAIDGVPSVTTLVLLQPTSPLRSPEDIRACTDILLRTGAPAAVSVQKARDHPSRVFTLDGGRLIEAVTRDKRDLMRQDLSPAYSPNGAVYAIHERDLRREQTFVPNGAAAYIMPRCRSIDVDEEMDLVIAEALVGYDFGIHGSQ